MANSLDLKKLRSLHALSRSKMRAAAAPAVQPVMEDVLAKAEALAAAIPRDPSARAVPQRLDELQMRYHEGPCVEAAVDELIVRSDDLRTERRWPMYSAAAAALGVRSALSFKLYTSSQTAGALNLFALEPGAFDAEAETIGAVLAAHAAAAIIASRQSEQLESALSTRDRIGQAKGIIMERYNIDDVAAFDMLRRLSQDGNTKLTEIAERVIQTRGT